jgi:hypothetical protein
MGKRNCCCLFNTKMAYLKFPWYDDGNSAIPIGSRTLRLHSLGNPPIQMQSYNIFFDIWSMRHLILRSPYTIFSWSPVSTMLLYNYAIIFVIHSKLLPNISYHPVSTLIFSALGSIPWAPWDMGVSIEIWQPPNCQRLRRLEMMKNPSLFIHPEKYWPFIIFGIYNIPFCSDN